MAKPRFHPENLIVGHLYEVELKASEHRFYGRFIRLKMIGDDFCAMFELENDKGTKTKVMGFIIKGISNAFEYSSGFTDSR